MKEQTISHFYQSEFENFSSVLPGQHLPWLKQLRTQALDRFSSQGFPSPREEEWKYTNVAAIEKQRFKPGNGQSDPALDTQWLQPFVLDDCWRLVFVDGRFSAHHSSISGLSEEVVLASLADRLEAADEKLQDLFGRAVIEVDHGFMHFNTAFFTDGLYLHVPEKTVLSRPIQVIHAVTRPDTLVTTRNLVVLDAMAEATVLETYVGIDDIASLTSSVTEVFVDANACLNLEKLQCETDKAFHFAGCHVQQARDARFRHGNFSFGGLLARNEIHCDLDQGSDCALNGLYTGVKRQHIDNHTRIIHGKPHAISREYYKGILDQRARGVFQGRVVVCEDAQKTDSEMNNRNLLLSENAEADTKPQLEIYADDVKCGHGVTVGQLEEKAVFYLQSRGVDEMTARNMLTFAFANEMVEKIVHEGFRALTQAQLLRQFPQTSIVREWL